jgi:cell division septation protein DedD
MRQGFCRPTPATIVALLALVAALITGSAYAAGRIDGRTVKVKSLPGNRLKLGSVPANRLKSGAIQAGVSGPITGSQIDERSLGQVPSAGYADVAGFAQSAIDAETAINAVNAVDAQTVNAGCQPGTTPFAGACWQTSANETPVTAPVAAAACAAQGGALPEALQLVAFAQQPDVKVENEEWSDDLTNFSGSNSYGVLTVSTNATVDMALPTATRKYRCVIPLLV